MTQTQRPDAAATTGTFADVAGAAELIINATAGVASVGVVSSIDPELLAGKTLLDVANPLDFSNGFPPKLSVCNTDSLGEQIQRTLPQTHVVKGLNTVTAALMVDPTLIAGDHILPIAGNDDHAKGHVTALLCEFGWRDSQIVDLGDISAARVTEMYLPYWIRLMGVEGGPMFNIAVLR